MSYLKICNVSWTPEAARLPYNTLIMCFEIWQAWLRSLAPEPHQISKPLENLKYQSHLFVIGWNYITKYDILVSLSFLTTSYTDYPKVARTTQWSTVGDSGIASFRQHWFQWSLVHFFFCHWVLVVHIHFGWSAIEVMKTKYIMYCEHYCIYSCMVAWSRRSDDFDNKFLSH